MSLRFQVPQEKIPTLGNRSFLMIGDRSLILLILLNNFMRLMTVARIRVPHYSMGN